MAGPPCFDFLLDVADNIAHLAAEDRLVQDPRAQELRPASIFANHRRNLDAYINEARQKMYSIREELEKS